MSRVLVLALIALTFAAPTAFADSALSVSATSSEVDALTTLTRCAVSGGGDVRCWGDNTDGALGTGDTSMTSSLSPMQVAGLSSGARSVSVGANFACAALVDGTVQCWGNNADGELGDGSTGGSSATPQTVQGLSDATAVTAGWQQACAITASSGLVCWGNGTDAPAPVSGASGVTAVTAGYDYACAIFSGGIPKCWGSEEFGELGDGKDNASEAVPAPVQGISGSATAISVGEGVSCAVTDTAVECWGWDNHSVLGNGPAPPDTYDPGYWGASQTDYTARPVLAPQGGSAPLGSDGQATDVSASGTTICAIDAGHVYCWDDGNDGELGNGTYDTESTVPIEAAGVSDAKTLGGSCEASRHGLLECWGRYPGDGSSTRTAVPQQAPGYDAGNVISVTEQGSGTGTVTSSPSALFCSPSLPTCSAPYGDGTNVALTATPSADSYFTGFAGAGCSGTSPTCTLDDLQSDQSVTVGFAADPRLTVDEAGAGSGTVTSSPSGIDCSGCTAPFAPGTIVTLSAQPAAGSFFVGFSGADCSGAPTCTITVSADTTVTASFDPDPTVSVNSPSDGAVYPQDSVPAAQYSCTAGQGQTLTACSAIVDGAAVGNGTALPATLGSHTMSVTATDGDGATAAQTVSYTVGSTGPGCPDAKPLQFGVVSVIGCEQPVDAVGQIPENDLKQLCARLDRSRPACSAYLQPAISAQAVEVTDQPVRINGLDFFPRNGSDLVFDTQDNIVAASHVSIEMMDDKVSVFTGVFQIDVSKTADVTAADDNLADIGSRSSLASAALILGGWSLAGTLTVTWNKASTTLPGSTTQTTTYSTTLSAEVVLPYEFKDDFAQAVTLTASTYADNSGHQPFQDFMVAGPLLHFGAFKLSNTQFCYQARISDNFCQQQTKVNFGSEPGSEPSWNVTGKVSIGVGSDKTFTLDAAPPPPTYGIGFVGGKFAFAGAQAQFNPGIPIGTGVTLTQIGGSLGLDPTRIYGTVGLGVASIAEIDGGLFLVLPEHGQTYTFTGSEAGVTASTLNIPKVTVNQFAMAVGGSLSLKIPVFGKTNLASGYIMYAYPSFVSFGGQAGIRLFGGDFVVSGTLVGTANFAANQYELDGDLQATIKFGGFINIGLEVSGTISSVGIAACGQLSWFGQTIAGGAGLKWGGHLQTMLGTCSLSNYQIKWAAPGKAAAVSATAASAGRVFEVSPGTTAEVIQVYGNGGAPDIAITGPSGSVDTAGREVVKTPHYAITRSANRAWVSVISPRPGVYHVRQDSDSVPLTEIKSAHSITPEIHASVSGTGTRRKLAFSQNLGLGTELSFIERGQGINHMIARTAKTQGTIAFRPSAGPGGVREVIAIATVHGIPQVLHPGSKAGGQLIVGHFRALGPRKLGRVGRLLAAERANRLTVTFAPGKDGAKYAIETNLKNGIKTQYETKRSKFTATIQSAEPAGGTVEVMALGDQLHTLDGPVARAAIKVVKAKTKKPVAQKKKKKKKKKKRP